MSSWSMNDGSALTGTMTFTNGNATVSGSGTNFDPQVKVGDIIISAGGVKSRVKAVASDTSLTLTENFSGSTENGVAATVTRPPLNFASAAPHIDNDVLGITNAESLAGVDNLTNIAVATGGTGYKTTKPAVTVAAPTARVITQANIDETTNVFTVTGHNMRDGTKLTYTSNGTNIVHSGGTLADGTAVFVRDRTENTFKIALSAGGTALDITNDGNDSNSFVGDTATVTTSTVTLSGGKVTSIPVAAVGSDYQAAPSITVAPPAEQTFNAQSAVSTANDTITLNAHSFATGDAFTYADKGGTVLANLTDGGTFFAIRVDANTIKVASTLADAAAGTAIDLTAGSSENHGITGVTATATAVMGLGVDGDDSRRDMAHIGWVKKTVGTGGRAGRVHYETLVAASSITGDAEDIATPDI